MKNKLFLCFRPPLVDETEQNKPDNSTIPKVKKRKLSKTKSSISHNENPRKTRVLKSSLSDTCLNQPSHRHAKDTKPTEPCPLIYSPKLKNYRSLPTTRSLPTSTSLSSTTKECSRSNSPLYFIFITVCITIVLGRFYAILFTSMFLYFLPRRGEFKNEEKLPEREENVEGMKRAVIMKGLLERNYYYREGIKLLTWHEILSSLMEHPSVNPFLSVSLPCLIQQF